MKKDQNKNLLIEQLKKMPIISVACEKVGVSRASVYRWRKDDLEFFQQTEEAIHEGIAYLNDLGENQLVSLMGEKRFQAVSFWLRHNHERYGAKPRMDQSAAAMQNLDPNDPKLKKIQELTHKFENDLRDELIKEIHDQPD